MKQLKIPSTKKLELDCLTRWNSTYTMLKTAFIYKDVFPRLKQRESLYKRVPSEEDWLKTKLIVDKLEMFYEATLLFSGTKYPTANLFFQNICLIRLAINDWVDSYELDVAAMALKMLAKFEKYWDTMHGLMSISSILDPRYKMKMIQFFSQRFIQSIMHLRWRKLKSCCMTWSKSIRRDLHKGKSFLKHIQILLH